MDAAKQYCKCERSGLQGFRVYAPSVISLYTWYIHGEHVLTGSPFLVPCRPVGKGKGKDKHQMDMAHVQKMYIRDTPDTNEDIVSRPSILQQREHETMTKTKAELDLDIAERVDIILYNS